MRKVLLLLIWVAPVSCVARAQWEQLPEPGGTASMIVETPVGSLYASTNNGIYRSTNGGASWAFSGLEEVSIVSITSYNKDGSDIVLACNKYSNHQDARLFRCVNGGEWDTVLSNEYLENVCQIRDSLYIVTGDKNVLMSKDAGLTWSCLDTTLHNKDIAKFQVAGDYIVGYTTTSSVWCFDTKTRSWAQPLRSTHSDPWFFFNDTIYSTDTGGIIWSINAINWTPLKSVGLPKNVNIVSLAKSSDRFLIQTKTDEYLSDDNGNTWQRIDTIQNYKYIIGTPVAFFDLAFAPAMKSVDGRTWARSASGLTPTQVLSVRTYHNAVYVAGPSISSSQDHGVTWDSEFVASAPLYASDELFALGFYLYRRDSLWTPVLKKHITSMYKTGNEIFAAGFDFFTESYRLYHSTDNGVYWDTAVGIPNIAPINSNLSIVAMWKWKDSLYFCENGYDYEMYHDEHGTLLTSNDPVGAVAVTSAYGKTWLKSERLFCDFGPVSFAKLSENAFYEATHSEFFVSFDTLSYAVSLFPYGVNQSLTRFACLDTFMGGVIVTMQDTIANLTKLAFILPNAAPRYFDVPTPHTEITSFASDDKYIYIGTNGRGIFRAPLASLPLAVAPHFPVKNDGIAIYPNPSADKATLSFSLPQHGHVSIELYDACGVLRQVAFNGERETGENDIAIDTRGLPNGIYEVVVTAGPLRMAKRIAVER